MTVPREKADVFRRILAYVIDAVIAAILAVITAVLLPPLAPLASALYLLFKDGLMFAITKQDAWKNKSPGKRLLNLEIVSDTGATIDLFLSAKRNLPLVIGALLELTFLASFITAIAGTVIGLVELYFVITDRYGRRLGDQWAHTQVTPARTL